MDGRGFSVGRTIFFANAHAPMGHVPFKYKKHPYLLFLSLPGQQWRLTIFKISFLTLRGLFCRLLLTQNDLNKCQQLKASKTVTVALL